MNGKEDNKMKSVEFNEKSLKAARRYLKQYHPAVWRTLDYNDSGYSIILAAIDCYGKSRKSK